MPRPEDYKAPKGTRKVYSGATPRTERSRDFSAGSILLQRLKEMSESLANIPGVQGFPGPEMPSPLPYMAGQVRGVGDAIAGDFQARSAANQPGPPYVDEPVPSTTMLGVPDFLSSFPSNVAQAEGQGLNLFDILSQGGALDPGAGAIAGGQGMPFEGGPLPTGPGGMGALAGIPSPQDVQGFNLFDMLARPDLAHWAGPQPPYDPALGVGPEANMTLGQAGQSALDLWPLPIMKTGEMLASGLGYGPEESQANVNPQFDLNAAQARMGQMTPTGTFGPGSVGVGQQAPPDQGGLGVLSQVLGPAAVLPAPAQEPLPPELNLAPVRAQFMQGRPQPMPSATGDYIPTPEGDLESLQDSYLLQGLAEGGLSGASAPIGEMLLRMGFGSVAGVGQGMAAREKVEALDREQMMALREEDRAGRRGEEQARSEFERSLAGLDLDIAQAELASDVARSNAIGQNLDRQFQHALAVGKQGAPQYLGMSSGGPVIMSTKDGQQSISIVQTPVSEVDRMSALADLVTSQAKLAEAKGKGGGGLVDPDAMGHSMYLAQIGQELVQQGGYSQLFDPDTLATLMEDVNERLGTVKQSQDEKTYGKMFNQALVTSIAKLLSENPDLIPGAGQFSSTAAQLSMAEELASGTAQ